MKKYHNLNKIFFYLNYEFFSDNNLEKKYKLKYYYTRSIKYMIKNNIKIIDRLSTIINFKYKYYFLSLNLKLDWKINIKYDFNELDYIFYIIKKK